MAKEPLEELLNRAIEASNRTTAASDRTTRAVRALVRFLFIQLASLTLGLPLIFFGIPLIDSYYSGIAWTFTILGGLIVFVGIIWSSSAGWSELSLSNPEVQSDYLHNPAPSQPSPVYSPPKKQGKSVKDDSMGERVCFKCERVYKANVLHCSFCDIWLDPRLNFKS
jgi:hypothetical protein